MSGAAETLRIGDVLQEFKETFGASTDDVPILTLTEHNGFVPQEERFNKRLATTDVSKYKVIRREDFAFNPYLLWAGALAQNDRFDVGVISPLYPTFRVRDGFDSSYLRHILLSPSIVQKYDTIAFGSVPRRRRSSVKDFLNLQLPAIPPLPEQRHIAAILDKATVLTAAVSQHGELVRSLWETTFNSHYAALSDVEPSTLDECSVIGSGITKGRKVPTSSELHDTPYLTVANVQDGYLALDEVKKIAVTEAEQEKYRLEHGDVLLTEGGDPDKLGRGTIWRDEVPGAINQNHVFRVRPNGDQVDPTYLALALRTPESRAYFHRQAKQTTGIATINKTQLRRTPVYLPSLDVQRHIVHRCEAVASTEASNNRRVEAARSLVAALQSRAFRGEL